MRTYNLFRLKSEHNLICAVAADYAVPAFIREAWEFVGAISEPDSWPVGFHPGPAADGARFHGFYLFQCFGAPRRSGADEREARVRGPAASMLWARPTA